MWSRFSFLLLICTPALGLRIVSTSPQVTEFLFQLGKGDAVVGTVEFSDYPNSAKKISRIGPLFFPGVEATVALKPDLVVLDENTPCLTYSSAIKRFGIPTLSFRVKIVSDLFAFAGEFLMRSQELEPFLEKVPKWNALVESRFTGSVKRKDYNFLILVWMDPVVAVGSNTYLSDFLTLASGKKGKNLIQEMGSDPYPKISEEWIVANRPDKIYFMRPGSNFDDAFRNKVAKWWSSPPKVVFLETDYFARASFTPLEHLGELE